jgi:hypothetical protein
MTTVKNYKKSSEWRKIEIPYLFQPKATYFEEMIDGKLTGGLKIEFLFHDRTLVWESENKWSMTEA